MGKIRVILLEPKKKAREGFIDDSLEAMQKTVGGCIERLSLGSDGAVLVCNEEGKINHLEMNRSIRDKYGNIIDIIHGTCFVCSCGDEDFDGLNDEMFEKYMKIFGLPEMFILVDSEIVGEKFDPEE